jgi:hypothetical protein
MFKTAGGNSGIVVANSMIIGNAVSGTYETFYCGADSDYIIIENCSVFNIPTDQLVKGNGFIKVKSLVGNANSKYFLPSEGLSVLPDPTLESANPLRQFTITTNGTATITLDSTTASSGINSLKFNRANLVDTCDAVVEVPMKPGDKAYMSFKHKFNVTQGAETWQKWLVSFSYMDNYGTILETSESFYAGNVTSFTKVFSDYLHNTKAKPGTAKLKVKFSMLGTGTAWIDDIYINIC